MATWTQRAIATWADAHGGYASGRPVATLNWLRFRLRREERMAA